MRLDVLFTPAERPVGGVGGRTAVVIDALRATSTIVEALANGARGVFPVETTEEAVRLAQTLGRQDVLLCGERQCLPIEGFDLGNSPAEFTRERVRDRLLVMTTTNGTPAFAATIGAERVLAAAFFNVGAVARELLTAGGDALVVCAGRQQRFALEDALCAGVLAQRLHAELQARLQLNDAAAAALSLTRSCGAALPRVLAATAAGRQLAGAGLAADVELCARLDRHSAVPRLRERQLTI